MKNVRFYEELEHKHRKGERSKGTVVAVFPDTGRIERNGDGTLHYVLDAVGGVFDQPNSPVASTAVDRSYLEQETRRIPERQAREVHPELFRFLDD